VLKYCSQEDTFVVVISKSGSTIETQANFALVYEWLRLKPIDLKKHIAVITDAEKGTLRKLANEKGLTAFTLPDNVGGRFSVLSPVGLVPAALLGVDVERILEGARSVVEGEFEKFLTMAAIYMHFMDKERSINVLMPYSSRLIKFAEWFCQLWGESLGKRRTYSGKDITFGTTPLRTAGSIDQHSQLQLFCEGPDDKFITFIGLNVHDNDKVLKTDFSEGFSYANGTKMGELLNNELKATEAALLELSRPTMRLNLQQLDEIGLGQLFMVFQYVIAVIGLANDINPFDQPGVEAGKDYVYGIMGKDGYDRRKEYFDKIYIKREEHII
jgi:glucose-6-phosphate isomerase